MVKSKFSYILFFVISSLGLMAQQAELSIQTGHNASIQKLCYSTDGKTLASADFQNKIILWDMETGGQMVKFYLTKETEENAITAISFNKEGNYFLAGTKTGIIYVFDVSASNEIGNFNFHASINNIVPAGESYFSYVLADSLYKFDFIQMTIKSISKDLFTNISRIQNGLYHLINLDGEIYTLNALDSINKHGYSLFDQNVLRKKKIRRDILNAKLDKKLEIATKPKKIQNLKLRKNSSQMYFMRNALTSAVYSKDGDTLFGSLANFKLKAISMPHDKVIFTRTTMYIDELFTSISLCNKYNLLFASNADGRVYVIDTKSGKVINYLKDHLSNVNDVKVSPDENYIASASNDRSIIIWNCKTLKPVRRLFSRAFSITSMDISNDGNNLVFADEIGSVKTIDLASVMLDINSIQIHEQPVPVIKFMENDSMVISAGNDNRISLINVNTSEVVESCFYQRYFQINLIISSLLDKIGVYIPPKSQMDSLIFDNSNTTFELFGGRFKKGKFTFVSYRNKFESSTLKKISSEKTGHEKSVEYFSYNQNLNFADTVSTGINYYNNLTGHTDNITGVKRIPGKNLIVTSSLDATLKIWDTENSTLLLTLIPVDRNKLIKLTSDNFYMAPKNALTAIGFKYGMKFFPPEQFDIRYNRPDRVMSALNTASPMLLKAYEIAFNKRLKKLNITHEMLGNDFHAPDVNVSDISCQLNTSDDIVRFIINANDSKYKLSRINVYNNDIPVFGTKGMDIHDKNSGNYSGNMEVKLIPGKNKIQVSALNEKGVESLKSTFEIYKTSNEIKPDLYVVSIGVSRYSDSRFNLNYAAKDANDVALLFNGTKGFYGSIYTKKIIDSEVTKENIIALKSFLEKSKPNDVVIVFIAGHGLLDEQFNYYFGTCNIDFNNPSVKGLEYSEIENLLDGIPAMKKLIFMDTCHSGEADKDELELATNTITETGNIKFRNAGVGVRNKKAFGMYNTNEMMKEVFADIRKGTGSTVVSSAGATEFAFEGKTWSNGLFTYCLIKGLKDGAADMNHDKIIVLSELQDYIRKNVTKLSEGMQVPNSRIENISMDFRIW